MSELQLWYAVLSDEHPDGTRTITDQFTSGSRLASFQNPGICWRVISTTRTTRAA